MSTWWRKNLGDPTLAGEALAAIEAVFAAEFEKAGRPPDMAVFIRHESGGLHCELEVYFSPAAVAVAKAVAASPCDRPSPQGLGALAGADDRSTAGPSPLVFSRSPETN